MTIETEIFKRYKPDMNKLIKYGFKKRDSRYFIKRDFFDNAFYAEIMVTTGGNISGKVYDRESGEEYVPLRIADSEGSFVAEVKSAYEEVLKDIRTNCFSSNSFISNQANRITSFIKEQYSVTPEFLWEDTPDCGVFRNYDSGKWFGIIMDIPYIKIDTEKSGNVEVINLKLDENKICELVKQDGYYPAWHMNKKKWISITLDGTLPDDVIHGHISESYGYTVKKKKAKS